MMISAYLDIIRIRFLMMLAYRVNYYSGIIIYIINIGASYFLWQAVYGSEDQMAGFSVEQMTSYLAISWMARAFYFNNLDREIASEIKDGSVSVQLIRPYKYLMVKVMQGSGEGLFRLLLFTIPGMTIAVFIFPITLPHRIETWGAFLIMIFFSFLINSQINVLTGLFAFFVENNEGLIRMKRVAVDLFSGLLIPISFFPMWAESILKWLPFQAITYLPASVFTGRVAGAAVWDVLLIQGTWFIVLLLPITIIWRVARRRLFVQGG